MTRANARTQTVRLRAWLSHPHLALHLSILAMLLALPSLFVGFQLDDNWHRMMFRGFPGYPGLYKTFWDQFTFVNGDAERTQRFLDYGFFPWWHEPVSCTQPWRPISVITHWADFLLWPEHPFPMHIQSLLWFGAMVAATSLLYRRTFGLTWIAGLAALFFALDDAHGWAVGWLANRNALISMFFGVLTLIVHDKWRRDTSPAAAFFAPILLAIAMLSAEASLAVVAYLVGYALFIEPSLAREQTVPSSSFAATRIGKNLTTLIPYVAVLAAWQILYKRLGMGAWGLGIYIDPAREPNRFLHAILERGPYLLLGQWAFPPSDIYVAFRQVTTQRLAIAVAAILLGIFAIFARRLWRDPVAKFFALGMLGSTIPICSTLPQDRLLFFVGLGAFGLIAQFIGTVFEQTTTSPNPKPGTFIKTLAVLFLVIHVVEAGIALPIRSYSPTLLQSVADELRTAPLDKSVADQTVVLVNPPTHFYAMYLPVIRTLDGLPAPKRVRTLAPNPECFQFTPVPMEITRVDDRTLLVRPEGGYEARPLLRNPDKPLSQGDHIQIAGLTVTITDLLSAGSPAAAKFEFDIPLDDPSFRFLLWQDFRFVPFLLPLKGQSIRLDSTGHQSGNAVQ